MRWLRGVSCALVIASWLSTTAGATVMRFRDHVAEPQNSPSDRPEMNRARRNLLTIRGQKDSRIEAWFMVTYTTTNDACRTRTVSQSLSGAPKIPQAINDYVRVPAGQTTFSVRVFLDKYAPGRCGWSAVAVGRAAFLPEESSGPDGISGFLAIRNEGSDDISARYDCRRRVNLPKIEPHFYLDCRPQDRAARASDTIASSGGTIDVHMSLETSVENLAPNPSSTVGI